MYHVVCRRFIYTQIRKTYEGFGILPTFKTITAILLLLFNGIRAQGQINVKNITNICWSI